MRARFLLVTPRPTKQRKTSQQGKRYDKARKLPIVVDVNDPKWVDLRDQLTDEKVLSAEDSAAVLHWIETGKGRPHCV
jgi:hypothetical protein